MSRDPQVSRLDEQALARFHQGATASGFNLALVIPALAIALTMLPWHGPEAATTASAQSARAFLPVALRNGAPSTRPTPYNQRATDRAIIQTGTPAAPTATSTPGRGEPDAPVEMRVRLDQRYRDDLPFVNDALVSLDFYTAADATGRNATPRPLMIYVHGGGWQTGDKGNVGAKAEAFVTAGWAFASINYRLSPAADFPAHVQDVAAAIAWLREQAGRIGVDGQRISLMGHSAGAHLVALVATDVRYLGAYGLATGDLSAVVPVDTQAYDIPALAAAQGGQLSDVYRQVFGETEDGWTFASPITYVRGAEAGSIPPMAVAYSGGTGAPRRPSPLRKAAAEGFTNALLATSADTILIRAPAKTHGQINQEIGTPGDEVTAAIFAFLARVGAGPDLAPAGGSPTPSPTARGAATRPPRATATPGPRATRPTSTPVGGAEIQRDLVYDTIGGRELRIDLYRPPGTTGQALPLVIWVHGGGWHSGSKDKTRASALVLDGFAIASVEYRLSREALWPAQIEDVRAAVRWLRANAEDLDIDPTRFAAWGSSAGGHLVAMLGTGGDVAELDGTNRGTPNESSTVRAVVNWYGPTDLLTIQSQALECSKINHDAIDSPEGLILGCAIPDCPDRAAHASPITYVSPADPPFLFMHGTEDCAIPPLQSQVMHDALTAAGVDSTLVYLEGAGHGGAEFTAAAEWQRVVDFLRDRMDVR